MSYWEKFGQIAFDNNKKAILTGCSLKNPDPNSKDPEIKCCFSFTVKRDMFNMYVTPNNRFEESSLITL